MKQEADKDMPDRGRPAHLPNVMRYNTPVILHVIVYAENRAVNTFANEKMHQILLNAWKMATSHVVGAYVLMPDHLHLFCAPCNSKSENIARWVKYWKAMATHAFLNETREEEVEEGQALRKHCGGQAYLFSSLQ